MQPVRSHKKVLIFPKQNGDSRVIEKVNGDGTYAIVYDDGDKEQSVAGYRVRGVGWKRKEVLSKDEVVDVHHGGGQRVFPGKVAAVNGDGTYDIAYDDGDAEQGVVRDLIEGPYVSGAGGDGGGGEPAKPSAEGAAKPVKPEALAKDEVAT